MKVFISSPLGGSPEVPIEEKLDIARAMCYHAFKQGHSPIAPHLIYPQFMSDSVLEERNMSIKAGVDFLKCCDQIWMYDGLPTSKGMQAEYLAAVENNIPIVYIHKEDIFR